MRTLQLQRRTPWRTIQWTAQGVSGRGGSGSGSDEGTAMVRIARSGRDNKWSGLVRRGYNKRRRDHRTSPLIFSFNLSIAFCFCFRFRFCFCPRPSLLTEEGARWEQRQRPICPSEIWIYALIGETARETACVGPSIRAARADHLEYRMVPRCLDSEART
jgi:hypothetical protein